MSAALVALVDQIASDGRVSADEALKVRRAVFPDGIVDRAEAAALFDLASRVANDDADWAGAFVEAIGDHVLGPDRFVHDDDAAWLMANAEGAGILKSRLLIKVLERAECAPQSLAAAARDSLAARIGDGPLLVEDLADIRTCLFALSGDGAVHVSEEELRWLFALDAATDGQPNDPAWGDLFVKAALNHVMAQRAPDLLSPAQQRARHDWLNSSVRPAPLSFLARAGEGGLATYRRRVGLRERDLFESHYETRLAEAADDGRLTRSEVDRVVALVRGDGRRTANEARLMDELERLHVAP
jgi:hypothetical protein